MEAVWKIDVEDFPALIVVDDKGEDFFAHTGEVTLTIGKRIVQIIEPSWLRIGGYWFPRGGIPINPVDHHAGRAR